MTGSTRERYNNNSLGKARLPSIIHLLKIFLEKITSDALEELDG